MTSDIIMEKQTERPQPQEARPETSRERTPTGQLVLGFVFGLIFGFLLQKGGVAKYEVLVGALLLQDFTVIQVMVSAIIVGMVGIFVMHRRGLVELHLKPTRYGANVVGGLIFGAGFALAAYCPGTGAVALGQGNFDAAAVIAGMMAGSYLFAEMSAWIGRTLFQWGDRGKLTLADVFRVPKPAFVFVFAAVLALGLWLLQQVPPLGKAIQP